MNSVRHLEVVIALATHRHFGKAAEALGISQPALTKSLRHIETLLGVALFDRGGVIAPTIFGEIVVSKGEEILNAFSELLREIELTKGVDSGRLSISVGPYPAKISAHEAMGMLSRAHPSIVCNLNVKDWPAVVDDVLKARCDLGFADISVASENAELRTEPVRRSPMLAICRAGHPLTKKSNIKMEDLLEFPWAGLRIPNSLLAILPKVPKPFGTFDPVTGELTPRLKMDSVDGLKRVISTSDALSAVPQVLLERRNEAAELAVLPIELPWLTLNYGFIWRRGRSLSPAAEVFKSIVFQLERRIEKRLTAPLHE